MRDPTLDTSIVLEIAKQLAIILVACLGSNGLWSYIQNKDKTETARDRMILGLGHAKIFDVAEKYIHRGGITVTELDDLIKYLYKPYAEMGGNGTAAEIVERCKDLPIITKAEADRLDLELYEMKGERK